MDCSVHYSCHLVIGDTFQHETTWRTWQWHLGRKGDTMWMNEGATPNTGHVSAVNMAQISEKLVKEALAPWEGSWLDPPEDWFSSLREAAICMLLMESLHCSGESPMKEE